VDAAREPAMRVIVKHIEVKVRDRCRDL